MSHCVDCLWFKFKKGWGRLRMLKRAERKNGSLIPKGETVLDFKPHAKAYCSAGNLLDEFDRDKTFNWKTADEYTLITTRRTHQKYLQGCKMFENAGV